MALPDWTVPFGEAFGDWKDLPLAYPGWRVAIPLRPGHLLIVGNELHGNVETLRGAERLSVIGFLTRGARG